MIIILVEGEEESETNGDAAAESAGAGYLAFDIYKKRLGIFSCGAEKKIQNFRDEGIVGKFGRGGDGDGVVKFEGDAEGVESGTEIGGRGWNAN